MTEAVNCHLDHEGRGRYLRIPSHRLRTFEFENDEIGQTPNKVNSKGNRSDTKHEREHVKGILIRIFGLPIPPCASSRLDVA